MGESQVRENLGSGTRGNHEWKKVFRKVFLGRIDSLIWGTVMARRSIYKTLLPFDPAFKNWADVDMWMRFCGEGSIGYVPEQLIELDQNPTHGGRFRFTRMAQGNEMVHQNIQRLFVGQERKAALETQKTAWNRNWRRWMLGRLKRCELEELTNGWAMRKGFMRKGWDDD